VNSGTCVIRKTKGGDMTTNRKQTIVFVDEDIEHQDLITAFFKPRNFNVVCYDCASKVLEESLSAGQSWDVLLTDYQFKDMLVADFTKELSMRLPSLPVVLMSPFELVETAFTPIDQGVYDVISKPINFSQLKVTIDQVLKAKILIEDNTKLDTVKYSSFLSNNLVGKSPKFLAAIDIAKRVSKSSASILISGESGTGKEVFANFIHSNSMFVKGLFIAINCSSIPENLLESELFGHTKGSFTGAITNRIGLFEEAENGTLFLDEIGDLSLPLQAKLLRVLQEKKIKRVGENKNISINCRIISATHKNLSVEIKEGRFREDLYFRLNVIPITLPPLRERQEDLLLLAETFLKKFAFLNDSKVQGFSKEAIQFISENKWKGNVRELENTVERAVVLCLGTEILLENFIPPSETTIDSEGSESIVQSNENTFSFCHSNLLPSLDEVINKYISYAIKKNGGARDKAARDIGIDRKTLYRRMQSSGSSHMQ
jgi:two-component system, NtrC family, response regulator HydG